MAVSAWINNPDYTTQLVYDISMVNGGSFFLQRSTKEITYPSYVEAILAMFDGEKRAGV